MPNHNMTRAEYDNLQLWDVSNFVSGQLYRYTRVDGYLMVPITDDLGQTEVKLEKALING